MGKNTSVSLGDPLRGLHRGEGARRALWVGQRRDPGGGLRLLEEEEVKLARLKELIAEGEASGGRTRMGLARAQG